MRILLVLICIASSLSAKFPLTINIYTDFNGKGLETDQKILQTALQQLGHTVKSFHWNEPEFYPADINIFLQNIPFNKIPLAKLNWFLPNPEHYILHLSHLAQMDLILCKTQQSVKTFQAHQKTYYLGFSSPDAYIPHVIKDFSICAHLAGGGHLQRATKEVLVAWTRYPNLPYLTLIDWGNAQISKLPNLAIIPYRVPEEEFRTLQNHAGIHICPSKTEGYGHNIMEAMSTGAIVITTNGPPMNEFIQDKRCLIPYSKSNRQNLARTYEVSPQAIAKQLFGILKLSPEERAAIGAANRREYLRRTQEFHQRLEALMQFAAQSI